MDDLNNWQEKFENCIYAQKLLDKITELNNRTKDLKQTTIDITELKKAIHSAARKGNTAVITELLDVAKGIADDNFTLEKLLFFRSIFGETALHYAAQKGSTALVTELLMQAKSIADDNFTLKKLLLSLGMPNKTALHYAAQKGNTAVVTELLDVAKGIADDNLTLKKLLLAPSISNETALHYATTIGDTAVVTNLLLVAEYIGKDTLKELLLSSNTSGETALRYAANEEDKNTLEKLLFAAEYAGKDTLKKLIEFQSNSNKTVVPYLNKKVDVRAFVDLLLAMEHVENDTLKNVLLLTSFLASNTLHKEVSTEGTKNFIGLFFDNCNNPTRSKRSTHEELGKVIDQDSNDNTENTENENIDTQSGGWLQRLGNWLQSLEWPNFTIFKGAEATVITDKIGHSEEYEYFYQTNYILSSSNVGRDPNLSTRPLIGNDTNNSVQTMVQGTDINGTMMLFGTIFRLKMGNNGNNYTSPMEEYEMNVDKLTSDIPYLVLVRELLLKDGLLEDDLLEGSLLDLLFASSSSNQLQGDIWADAPA